MKTVLVKECHVHGAMSSTDDVIVTDERAATGIHAVDVESDLPRPPSGRRLLAVHDERLGDAVRPRAAL